MTIPEQSTLGQTTPELSKSEQMQNKNKRNEII